jgi:cell volume regulation protein A
MPTEPHATALLFAVIGTLMAMSAILSRFAGRISVPVALLYLGIGMLAGSEGLGHIQFQSYHLAFRLGTLALVLILFDGGLNTSVAAVRRALRPASALATAGVLATALGVAAGARALGMGWRPALLVGAVVSSTDAASVFAILRSSGVALERRIATTLELESGLNDPTAVLLTVALTRLQIEGGGIGAQLLVDVLVQIAVGLGFGLALGRIGVWLLQHMRLSVHGLLPVLTAALALAAFGVPTLFRGSGFLAVYVSAMVLGNAHIPLRNRILRVHDALAWLSQVIMFLVLGLLSIPSRLWQVGGIGLALGLLLAFVVRPLSVALCLIPFRYRFKEILYVGWVGLRGAVPIILATFPVLAGVPEANRIFNIVLVVVVATAIVPGMTVQRVTRWLGLESRREPLPKAVLEIHSAHPLTGELQSFFVEPSSVVAGARISELPFPASAAVVMIVRNDVLIAPRGDSVLTPGDHVYVLSGPEDRALVLLMFGRSEE